MRIVFFIFLFTGSLWATPPEQNLSFQGKVFSYFSSHDLNLINPAIKKAVIVVHGSERNADTYFNGMADVCRIAGKTDSTVIVSPHFKLETDTLLPSEFTWTDEGWLSGDLNTNGQKTSSFTIIDNFVETFLAHYPALEEIIVTGHSAGGQLTQRYAVGSKVENKFSTVKFRYIVLNPGSYVYLNAKRPVMDAEKCAYNDYKYGLDHRNAYMGQFSVENLVTDYLKRKVVYMVGDLDNTSADIDQACPARYQGPTRRQRGQLYLQTLNQEFPFHNHLLFVVPNVAHTQHGMYHSATGLKVLWEN